MVIKINNLAKCIKKFGDIGDIDVFPVIKEGTYRVQAKAQSKAPVYGGANSKAKPPLDKNHRGGTLKGSIKVKLDKKQKIGQVYTTLEYGPHQEFGTVFQVGTPFMIPAMNEERLGIVSSMNKYLRDKTNKIVK